MHLQRPTPTTAAASAPPRQTVLWLIAILLAVIATVLIVRPPQTVLQPAFGDTPMAGARGLFAFTGQIDKDRYGLFMMDVDNSTVWLYEYMPATRKLKLAAARSFAYDRYLENWNNAEPTPAQIPEMLERQRQIEQRNRSGGVAAPGAEDPLDMMPTLSPDGGGTDAKDPED